MDNSSVKLNKFGHHSDTNCKFNRYFTILVHNNTHHLNFYLPSSKFNLIFLHGTKNFRIVLNKTNINNISKTYNDSDDDEDDFVADSDSVFNTDTCFDTPFLANHNGIAVLDNPDELISSDENSLDDNTPYEMQQKILANKIRDQQMLLQQPQQQPIPIEGAMLIGEHFDNNIWEIPQNDYRTIDFSKKSAYSVESIINIILKYNVVYIKNFNSSHFSLLQNISNKWNY